MSGSCKYGPLSCMQKLLMAVWMIRYSYEPLSRATPMYVTHPTAVVETGGEMAPRTRETVIGRGASRNGRTCADGAADGRLHIPHPCRSTRLARQISLSPPLPHVMLQVQKASSRVRPSRLLCSFPTVPNPVCTGRCPPAAPDSQLPGRSLAAAARARNPFGALRCHRHWWR